MLKTPSGVLWFVPGRLSNVSGPQHGPISVYEQQQYILIFPLLWTPHYPHLCLVRTNYQGF